MKVKSLFTSLLIRRKSRLYTVFFHKFHNNQRSYIYALTDFFGFVFFPLPKQVDTYDKGVGLKDLIICYKDFYY